MQLRSKICFLATSTFAVPSLRELSHHADFEIVGVITQPDKKVGRSGRITPTPIKSEALKSGLKVFEPDRHEIAGILKSLEVDLGVVISYGAILPDAALTIPKFGCVNLHASLLPKYRGASPVQSALLAGETETGLTLIQMNKKMDRGDILMQVSTDIYSHETAGMLLSRLADEGSLFLPDALPKLFRCELESRKQDESKATYCRKLSRDDGLISWDRFSAETIIRMFRAFDPWPGIFTFFQGKRLKITSIDFVPNTLSDSLLSKVPQNFQPGKVIMERGQVFVVTVKDALLLKNVQIEGRKEMDTLSFVRGNPSFADALLGR